MVCTYIDYTLWWSPNWSSPFVVCVWSYWIFFYPKTLVTCNNNISCAVKRHVVYLISKSIILTVDWAVATPFVLIFLAFDATAMATVLCYTYGLKQGQTNFPKYEPAMTKRTLEVDRDSDAVDHFPTREPQLMAVSPAEYHWTALQKGSYWPDSCSSEPPGNRFHRWRDTAAAGVVASVAYGSADACPLVVSRPWTRLGSPSRRKRTVVWQDLQLNWTTLLVWGVFTVGAKKVEHERKRCAKICGQ